MIDMQTHRLRLALFDLDHTLLPLDSDYEWGEFTIRIGWNDPVEFARRNDEFYAHYQAGTLDVHDYVRFATEAVRLRGPEAAAAAHQQFMREVITPAIKPQALDLIRQHQAAGDEVLIVTATNEFVTTPIAQALGVPAEGRTEADVVADLAPAFDRFVRAVGLAVSLAKDGLGAADAERLAAATMAPENKAMRDSNIREIAPADARRIAEVVLTAA